MSLKSVFLKLRKKVNSMSIEKEIKIKYPLAKHFPELPLMARGGTYKNKFPEGVIVHFTAGWQSQKPKDAINFANKNGHRYFFLDQSGTVYQQFDLSGYGPHAGESLCPVTKRSSVAKYYVGIEIACGGKLTNGKTWYGKEVLLENQRKGIINNKWQKSSGVYEKFTPEQEDSLIELCIWLCKTGCDPDLIFSHEEVSPGRKDDVGLALSITMDEFRDRVKKGLGT